MSRAKFGPARHSSGQLDTEFAYPSSVLRKPGLVLVCDRLAEDLVGEGLVKTFAAAKAAAEKAGNAQAGVCFEVGHPKNGGCLL